MRPPLHDLTPSAVQREMDATTPEPAAPAQWVSRTGDTVPPPTMWTGIVWCPCCCSPVDVEALPETPAELDCGVCGQPFTLTIDPERFTEHSLH